MDRIVLEGLEFHGYHGVFPEEATFGARFVVDAELHLPLDGADELSSTVDYSLAYDLIREQVTERRFTVIEALAHAVAKRILDELPRVASVRIRVHKPHAPLPGVLRDVFVEIERSREDLA